MPVGTLSGEAKDLFERIYNESRANGDSPEVAARKAWSGIKSAGWSKNKDGEWVKGKADVFQEFSMAVSKVSFDKATQERHITLVASDTDADLADEKMSIHLFQDFVNRIEQDIPVPEAFRSVICEDGWCGGQPYLSISHYKSAGGTNVPGEIRVSYVDGNRFKSKAVLSDTELGKAVFKSLNDDLTGKSKFDDKVRVSIGFLDLAHKHGDYLFERKSLTDICPKCAEGEGSKEYWEGVLVHEAFTRKPMNPRTDVEVQRMAILTKKDDAESIVGEEILAQLDLEAKSQVSEEDEVVVIRSEHMMDEDEMHSGTMSDGMMQESLVNGNVWYLRVPTQDVTIVGELKGIFEKAGWAWETLNDNTLKPSTSQGNSLEAVMSEEITDEVKEPKQVEPVKEPETVETPAPVQEESAVDKAVAVLRSKLSEIKAKGAMGDNALQEIQPVFNELGAAVKSELTQKADPATANIAEIVRSAVAEQMALVVVPLEARIAELSMKSGVAAAQKRDEGVVARSLTLRPQIPSQSVASPQLSKIQQIAWKSTES